MYGKFSVGYRIINERATVRPQFRPTSLEGEYVTMQPTYVKYSTWNNQYGHTSG